MRHIAKAVIAATLASTFTACLSDPADSSAGTPDVIPTDSDSVAEKVARLLAVNPGSVQIGPNRVQLDEGVIAVVPSENDRVINPDSASGRCLGGNLCLFENINFKGSILQLSNPCHTVTLSQFNMDNGHPWNNQTSSIDNPSPRPGPARFFNNGVFMLALNGGSFLRDLTKDTSADGTGNANDKIDTVRTCP